MLPIEEKPSGLLVDMVKSVKSSIDKGVQKIKDLVKPKESETYEVYDARPPPVKTYSLGIDSMPYFKFLVFSKFSHNLASFTLLIIFFFWSIIFSDFSKEKCVKLTF